MSFKPIVEGSILENTASIITMSVSRQEKLKNFDLITRFTNKLVWSKVQSRLQMKGVKRKQSEIPRNPDPDYWKSGWG